MFDQYDNELREYVVTYADGSEDVCTAEELHHFYILNDVGISDPFDDLKRRLDRGEVIVGRDNQYDWGLATNVYKGNLQFKKRNAFKREYLNKTESVSKTTGCDHSKKYINQAGGIRFYVCPDCKADLGDA